jgi:cytoskeletal protein CcmA (bactofilin family)
MNKAGSSSQFPVISSRFKSKLEFLRTANRQLRTFLCALVLFCLALSSVAFAKDNPSFTQVGHNITIGPNDQVGDLTCFACSIRVRGQVAGDVTAFGGSVVIEDHAQVAGDVTAFGGDIRLDEAVKVAGDATVFGGQIRRDPAATISGDVTSMGGHGWLVPIVLAPFLAIGLLVAFVLWLVQRTRRPSAPAVA